jgi:hypothetical protein
MRTPYPQSGVDASPDRVIFATHFAASNLAMPQAGPGYRTRSSVFRAIFMEATSTICPSTLTEPEPSAFASS